MSVAHSDLARRLADVAILRGNFTLRSGRTSTWYLDKYRFTTQPDVLRSLGDMFGERVHGLRDAGTPIDRLAGAELGGIPLVTAASMATGIPCIFIRNQKKDYGTAQQLEGVLEAGNQVVVVEDVATSGGQVLEAAKTIEAAGAHVAMIIATVDRQEGARENIESAGYTFDALFTASDLGVGD